MVLQAKPEKEAGGLTIYVGDQVPLGAEEGVTDINFRLAGRAAQVSANGPSRVELFGIGTHVRLVFDAPDKNTA